MNSNTSYYKEYSFLELLKQYDKILIPMIQRDYAQGRTNKKATDVRNNLLNDIFSGKKVHFDLVFGSVERRIVDGDEKRCFIPVDGQQRLTTLFLLYLYGQRQLSLYQELDLSKFSYDTRRAAADFCKSITKEKWHNNKGNVSDAIKDCSWFMGYWAQDPTVEGMLNMLDAIHEKYKQGNTFLYLKYLENVTFYFFDLESNGLNENLYLKMNSRGKPLTAFENLKAKIEKVLPDNIEIDEKFFPECDAAPKDSFKEKWKFFMDRNWTETFWDSENPSKYDVNIAKFIVRFLAGYWAAFGKVTAEETTTKELVDANRKEQNDKNYADYIKFEPIEKVLKLENAFSSLAYALTTVINIAPYWTNDTIKVSDKSEYKLLTVIFTNVLFDRDNEATRFAWNMAENYVTEYDTFVTYCKRAGEIHRFKGNKNVTFYKALSDIGFIGNTSDQLKEEIAKAKQILNSNCDVCEKFGKDKNINWEEIIVRAEQYAFFRGAIRFLFTDGEGNINWCDFYTKYKNAQTYFEDRDDKEKNGVKESYSKQAILLRYYISQFRYWDEFWGIEYDNKPSTWKQLLLSSRYRANHIVLMNHLEENYDFKMFKPSLEKLDANFKDLQEAVQNELVTTEILVKASLMSMRLNWRYNNYCLYPYNTKTQKKIYVIANHRNAILSELITCGCIKSEQKIEDCGFFWGWNINFTYGKNNVQWTIDNQVYLMSENDPNIRAENQPDNYPFDASSINAQAFKEKLCVLDNP